MPKTPDRFRFRCWDKENEKLFRIDAEMALPVDNSKFVIQQSTGVCDSRGKEIFEGDIVYNFHNRICNGKYGEVVFALGSWMILDDEGALDMPVFENACSLTIVGNCFENKELMK